MALDPLSGLTLFVTQMIGLSVAAERVTETIKQWASPMLSRWSASRYSGAIQTVAVLSGIAVTALSGLNPLNVPLAQPFVWANRANWLSWLITGILVSGGSAFWNHVLDILKAVKVQKEQLANAVAQAGGTPLIAP